MNITKEQIKTLAALNSAASDKLKQMFPEAFEPDNACSDYNDDDVDEFLKPAVELMGLKRNCIFSTIGDDSPKGFYLSDYKWVLKTDPDDEDCYFLIPYKK